MRCVPRAQRHRSCTLFPVFTIWSVAELHILATSCVGGALPGLEDASEQNWSVSRSWSICQPVWDLPESSFSLVGERQWSGWWLCVSLCPSGCDEQSSWSPTVHMSLGKKQIFVVLNHRSLGVLWSEFPDTEPPGGWRSVCCVFSARHQTS